MSTIKSRAKVYLVGKPKKLPADAVEVEIDDLKDEIEKLGSVFGIQGVDGEKLEPPARVMSTQSSNLGEHKTLVIEMTDQIKEQLIQRHGKAIIIEPDEPLIMLESASPVDSDVFLHPEIPSLLNVVATEDSLVIKICVKGTDGKPVSKAKVSIAGSIWIEKGFTNIKGKVQLELFGETIDSIRMLEIKPAHTHWSLRISEPVLEADQYNEVTLKEIDSIGNQETQFVGWGQQDMGLVDLPAKSNKVKIAVIDSGITQEHPDLKPINGFDFGDTDKPKESWQKDGSGHGTHVAGICAAKNNEVGILGFAPGSELNVLRVFPNASNSKLIGALDWCIDNKIDVVNMSLGGKNGSDLVRQRIQSCRENGVLLVAAAGNSGNNVLYPAAFSEVVAVSAIGRFDSFPDNSSHHAHIGGQPIQSGDYFSPGFTCRGEEIDVCAPGVAITSSVPAKGYAAWDGTSMACPHVSGFVARLLQMRNDIRQLPRNHQRSQALFDALIEHCTFLEGIPKIFQGSGFPVFAEASVATGSSPEKNNDDISLDKVESLLEEAILLVKRRIKNLKNI